ncbi:MAG: hypothetical protein BAJALOKI1v1_1080001 [Promethearchaeota archaeon]|nr:MAG: hypothetical protein BAJALOKI1v1_1080001 [Candidatus Lokiarchaeota archaeon]
MDPLKLVINTILTTSLIWASLDPANIVQEAPNNIPTLNVVGSFLYTFIILIIVTSAYMIYISAKIFIMTPQEHSSFQGGDELRSIFLEQKKSEKHHTLLYLSVMICFPIYR